MKELIGIVEQSLRSFFKDKMNAMLTINIIFFIVILIFLGSISLKIDKIKKKVDHRYFNITNSLQDIHGVEIDTYKGRVVKKRIYLQELK